MAVAFDARKGIPGFKYVQYFYRNKSVEYFNTIMQQRNGEMIPYLKSNGGEQGSVLNGRLPKQLPFGTICGCPLTIRLKEKKEAR
jgi:hypothetical protein